MRDLAIILAGRANYLLDRILDSHTTEDYDYFIHGLCESLMGAYDEEWEGYLEDNNDCLSLMTILHALYRPRIMAYLDRMVQMGNDGFEVSIIPLASEGVNLLMVKSFTVFADVSYAELNLL